MKLAEMHDARRTEGAPYPRAAKAAFILFAVVCFLFLSTVIVSCVANNAAPKTHTIGEVLDHKPGT